MNNASLLKEWKKIFASFPVAVNNFYGDPLIQWSDTLKKLEYLTRQGHKGVVTVITKGVITNPMAERFRGFIKRGLKLLVCVSISELPQFEKVGMEHRYKNFSVLNNAGIRNLAFVRPMTPPYNTDSQTINRIVDNLALNGCQNIVLSGFRGDDNLVKDMTPSDKVKWTMRVKLLTPDVFNEFKQRCEEKHINLFMRVSCAVAHVFDKKRPLNPYYNSPLLCKCEELNCPLLSTCKRPEQPREGSLELLRFLGFDVRMDYMGFDNYCTCTPDHRLECKSCCTTCFNIKTPRLTILNKCTNLGTLTFCRYVTGILCAQEGVCDEGDKDVGYAHIPMFPQLKNLACLNSWYSYAQHGTRCFDCEYCVDKYYQARNNDLTPLDLYEMVVKAYITEGDD